LVLCLLFADYLDAGLMALPRSPLHNPSEIEEKMADEIVDHSSLPPG